ncbi:MAG: hypothetical protein QOE36_471 [Gaiellaceae bacterium]|jgi:hypothetical protein|nr:hypothetical protein [Gaiellaceae bacterium]
MSENDDLRTFIREVTLRFERGIERISRDIRLEVAEHRRESRRYFEVLDRKLDESERRTSEIIAENRTQRDALFRILDRLDGNGGTAPAG